MRMTHLSIMAAAALGTFGLGASAITAQPNRAPATAPLYQLSERDLSATRESGCECTFRVGRRTLFQMIGDEVTIRTRAGRQTCPISADQFSALSNDRGNAACGGLRMSFRRTGRVSSHPASDSADWPSALTIGQGRARRTLAGRFGCAC